MATLLYAEINCLCIVILVMLAFWINKSSKATNLQQLVRSFMFAVFLFASDLFWSIVDQYRDPKLVEINYIANILYFSMSGVCACMWFRYVENLINCRSWKKKSIRILSSVPAAALVVLSVASRYTGWFFSISPNNEYIRGPLHWLQIVISLSYLIFSSIHAYFEAHHTRAFMEKEQLNIISTFVIMPLACGIAQNLLAPGLPLLCAGITISFLIVFANLQDRMITRDALTQLNNRYRLMNYLEEKTEQYKSGHVSGQLYLLMSDVDSFKKINDGFGHPAGDRALCATADALKNVCSRWNCFAARYGGDEFILVYEAVDEDEIRRLCDEIKQEIARFDTDIYHLSLSIGYARYDPSAMNVDQLIELADKHFYTNKNSYHARNAE